MNIPNTTVRLGATVRDMITGFTGIAASRTEMMGGNVQFAVQPKVGAESKPGEFPDGMNIDHHTLEFVDAGVSDRATEPGPVTIEIGDNVRDIVTGMEGIAVNRVTFINGCIYYNVQPPAAIDKQTGMNKVPDRLFLNQACLEAVKKKVAVVVTPQPTTAGRVPGGPNSRAQRQA